MKILLTLMLSAVLTGCLGMPDGIEPVQGFQVDRYLGKWYEVARLDHSFERGLEQITANYSLRDDGGLSVVNRGYSIEDNEWSVAEGKAYFVDSEAEAYLKVSFFGPFYGSYVIFELEKDNYEYAFISGPDLSYLWLLSRKPNLDQKVIDDFIEKSKNLGFDVDKIIFVKHDEIP